MKPCTLPILAAVAAIFLSGPAASEPSFIRLETPLQGASLHEGSVDLVAYYIPQTDGFEVVATFADRDRFNPARLRMLFADGDEVSFGLPGKGGVFYHFARVGSVVVISATPVPEQPFGQTES